MEKLRIPLQTVSSHPLPVYQTKGSSGMDLHALLATPIVIPPLGRALVPTGIHIALPPNTEGQIRARSGLAYHHGITVLNSPGTIDSDFRGEVHILLVNLSSKEYTLHDGVRIAQLVIVPTLQIEWELKKTLEPTKRGSQGFGSTG